MSPQHTRPDCIDPAFLQEGELLAFASASDAASDGLTHTRRQAVQSHLKHCPHCAGEVAELAVWNGLITTMHEAATCPSPLSLLSFSAGLMPVAERMPVASHLLHCAACQQALVALDQAHGQDPAVTPLTQLRAWWKVLADAVQPLVSRLLEPVAAQAMAVRGESTSRTLLFRGPDTSKAPTQAPAPTDALAGASSPSTGTEIVISWLPPEPPDDHWQLSGQLISAALDTDTPAMDVLVSHGPDLGQRVTVDEFGFFTAAVTDPRELTLLVFFPEHIVEIGPFTLT